jgi:hypothetical protein
MSGISPLMGLLFAWAAVTTVFVILMIYRSLVRQMLAGQRARPRPVASRRVSGPSYRPPGFSIPSSAIFSSTGTEEV